MDKSANNIRKRRGSREMTHRATLASEAVHEMDALVRMALTTRFSDNVDHELAVRGILIRIGDLLGVVMDVQHGDAAGSEETTDLERVVYGDAGGVDHEPMGIFLEAANG